MKRLCASRPYTSIMIGAQWPLKEDTMFTLIIESFTRSDRVRSFHSYSAAVDCADAAVLNETCTASVYNHHAYFYGGSQKPLYETSTKLRKAA